MSNRHRLLTGLFIASAIAGLLMLILLGLAILLPHQVDSGPLERQLTESFGAVGEPVHVTTRVDPGMFTDCSLAANRPRLDMIVVLDRSSSMLGDPLEQAKLGAQSFVDRIDLSRHQVSVVFFNGAPALVAGLSQDRAALKEAIATAQAEDGTRVDLALQVARDELAGPRHRLSAQTAIVLFTDGGSDERPAAASLAQTVRSAGTHILAVGYVDQEYAPEFMQQLVSSPSDLYAATDVNAIQNLYDEIALSANTTVANQVVIEESYNVDAFQAPSGVTPTAAASAPGALRWGPTWLTDRGITVQYTLEPKTWGWLNVSNGKGRLSLVDCRGTARDWPNVAGPALLVLPFPPMVPAILGLLLFLLPLFALPFSRRPKLSQSPEPAALPLAPAAPPIVPPSMSWVDHVQALSAQDTSRSANTTPLATPALIVGMGETGRWVLTLVKKNLLDRYGGHMPEQVRLLLVDFKSTVEVNLGGVSLSRDEILPLDPNFKDIDINVREDSEQFDYLRWWQGTPDDPGRAAGRAGIFYDLQHENRLYKALSRVLQGLGTPNLFLVSSLCDDVGSGMIWDLAHLVTKVSQMTSGTRPSKILTWLALADIRKPADESRQQSQCFAGLRELERFTFKKTEPFIYGAQLAQRGLVSATETTPVDLCFLFDTTDEVASLDLKNLPPDQGLPVAMADALTILLDPAIWSRFDQDLDTALRDTGQVQETTRHALASSLGVYVYKLPIEDIRRAAEAHFVYDLLFGEIGDAEPNRRAGLFVRANGENAPDARGGNQSAMALASNANRQQSEPGQEVIAFLRGNNLHNKSPLFAALGDALAGGTVLAIQVAGARVDLREVFRASLQEEIMRLLNGDGDDYIAARSGKLAYVEKFLALLQEQLPEAERRVRRMVQTDTGRVDEDLRRFIQGAVEIVRQARSEVRSWIVLVNGEDESEAVYLGTLGHDSSTAAPSVSLYERSLSEWTQARQILERLRLGAKTPTHEVLIGKDLEEPYYLKHMRPELSRGMGVTERAPIERALQRIGWVWEQEHQRWQLRLVVLPPLFAGPADSDAFQYNQESLCDPQRIDALFETLRSLARVFSREISEKESISEQLKRQEVTPLTLADQIHRGLHPLIKYGVLATEELVKSAKQEQYKRYVAAPNRTLAEQVRKNEPDVFIAESQDPHVCGLAISRHFVPVKLLDAFAACRQQYTPDPALHVFPAEQTAVRIENKLRQLGEAANQKGDPYLHPLFVRLLEYQDLAFLFGQCLLNGWVHRQDWPTGDADFQVVLPDDTSTVNLGHVPGPHAYWVNAMDRFALAGTMVEDDFYPLHWKNRRATVQKIKSALQAAQQSKERKDFLKTRKTFIQDLCASPDEIEQNLGAFLKVVVEDE